jgi:hypothetical protein
LGLVPWKVVITEIGDCHGFLRNWRFVLFAEVKKD